MRGDSGAGCNTRSILVWLRNCCWHFSPEAAVGPTSYNILIKALLLIWEALWLTVSRASERRGWRLGGAGCQLPLPRVASLSTLPPVTDIILAHRQA